MFFSKKNKELELTTEMIKALSEALSTQSASTERLEALSKVITALNVTPDKIGSVEVDWKKIQVGDNEELVPTFKLVTTNKEIKTLEQIESNK